MKLLISLFFILSAYGISAQGPGFVRVYNLKGQKINKGQVAVVTDTSLQLQKEDTLVTIPVTYIGSIKTKRSAGNNLLTGAIIGASAMAIIGAVTADPNEWVGWTAGEGAAGGAIIGLPLGAAIGGISILFKNSKTYLINGDTTKWKAFQSAVTTNN